MSGRVVTLDASIHRTVQMLLPWFAAGTLDAEKIAMVQEHLDVCTECRGDVEWQRKLQVIEPGREAGADVERAWSRLQPLLEGVRPRPERKTVSELLTTLLPSNLVWMRWALAAQMVLVIGLASLAIPQFGEHSAYHLLGESHGATGNVVVVFKPSTSEQDIRRILEENSARIADGPTATGAYLLKIADAGLPAAIDKLRSESDVMLAESLDSGAHP